MIVCLGDLVTDVVVTPSADLRRGTDTAATIVARRGGSAANVSVAVRAAGGRSRFVGAVGDDRIGDALLADLRGAGVELAVARTATTGTIVVVLDRSGERSFFTDRGACTHLQRAPRRALHGAAVLHLPAYSLDGEPLATTARRLAARARRAGALLTLDASSVAVLERIGPAAIADLGADVVFANRDEATFLARSGPIESFGGAVVVKDGAGPATLHTKRRAPATVPVVDRLTKVPDSTGAGDWFAGGALVALAAGRTLDEVVAAGHRHAAGHLRSLGAR